ncbi:MAG: hypothetical protein ABL983_06805 [Nitrospira sp.]
MHRSSQQAYYKDSSNRIPQRMEQNALPPNTGSIFSNHKAWWLVLFAMCLAFAVIFPPGPSSREGLWAYALGSGVAMFITALVLAGIPWLISVIARRKMTTVQFMFTFTIAIGLVMTSLIMALEYEKKTDKNFGIVNVETVFAPANSDFAVTFSARPTIEEFEGIATDGGRLKGTRAELRAQDSFQRVEVVSMPRGFSEGETKESVISKLRDYAIHNGITAPEFKYEVTTLGKRASMRGTKILDDSEKPRAVTYENVTYFGDTSIVSLYVGAPSESYPTTRVLQFLKSVTKNSIMKK